MIGIFTALYGNEKAIIDGFESKKKSMTGNFQIYAINNHYPLWSTGFVERLGKEYNINIIDEGCNLGHMGGIRRLNELIPTDYHFVIEPDSVVHSHGWDRALLDVVHHPTVSCATIANKVSYAEMDQRGHTHEIINGHKCTLPIKAVMTGDSVYKTEWIKGIGGHWDENKYYGGSEVKLWEHFTTENRWAFVDDYRNIEWNEYDYQVDDEYNKYKDAHARTLPDERFTGSFEDWLENNLK